MNYKLLCIDIDGTLLDDEKRIPVSVKACLQRASAMGIRIVLASGRMPAGVEMMEKELGIDCIKICNAGTYILMDEKCIGAEYLSIDSMRSIDKEIAGKNRVPLWIFREKDWYVTAIDKYVEREIEIIPYTPKLVETESLARQWESWGRLPNKLLIAADAERVPSIYQNMKERMWQDIDIACSADTFIEIFPMGVDKGKALRRICDYLNVDLREVIAFGDQELDIPMIEAAGTGVAMGNAISRLKEKADFITKTNNDAGIAYALEHYLG